MALSGLQKHKSKQAAASESDEASDNDSDNSGENNAVGGNAGWADSIAKVLRTTKPKSKKTLVLSRAKKNKVVQNGEKSKEDYGFEIDGEIKEEKNNDEKTDLDDKTNLRKNVPLQLRVKPSWKDMERERSLRKVATRGVVQLFNAVRIQQKELQQQLEEAGPLDSRQDAVLNNINKRKFLDVLMSGNRSQSQAIDNPVKNENNREPKSESSGSEDENDMPRSKKKSEWDVLRDDFMTNKKAKHWDEDDQDSDNSAQQDTGEDTDGDDS